MNTRSRTRAAAAAAASSQTNTGPTTSQAGEVVANGVASTSTRSVSTSTVSTGTSTADGGVSEMARYRFNRTRLLMKTERKLIRSCEHVVLLNDRIRGLSKRYQKARADGFKSFRYNIRIRLAAVEGVRNMYYEYARDRAEEVAELRKELYDQNVQIVTGSDPDEADDEYEIADDDDQSSEEDMDTEDDEEAS